jgi:hypothetical protein
MIKLIIQIQDKDSLIFMLKKGAKVLDRESLTVLRGFDNISLGSIDKLLARNKIDKTTLKNIEIAGKIDEKSISGMIIKTMVEGFRS